MKYAVRTRRIYPGGVWEEWEERVEADDRVAALVKVLRRRNTAEYLLGGDRYRFNVVAHDSAV